MLQTSTDLPAILDDDFRLLVVSDDRASCQHLVTLAKRSGYRSIDACEGGEATAAVPELRPDLIIVDGPSPALQGIDLVRMLRASALAPQPYIILVVSREDELVLAAPLESGVDDMIRKPLRPRMVAARLRTGYRILRLQRENERQREELRRCSEALTRSNRRLREFALTDELTGLPNRRYAMERLQLAWAAAARNLSPLSCLVIDLDGVQAINELRGHERGDVVLKTVAAILRQRASAQDIVCRIGGDEFLVICPETSLDEVVHWGEALVGAVGRFEFEADGHSLGLSMGAAERRPAMSHHQELVSLAEQHMYRAKRLGKNLVCASGKEIAVTVH